MKNRYLKNARIPERKVRELLNLFCEDLTATQIANISGISRITVNAYLKLIRTQIAQYCEEMSPYYEFNRNSNPFSLASSHGNQNALENYFYGILKVEHSIYTKNILHVDPVWLNNWVRGKITADKTFVEQHDLHIFEAVADFSRAKLYRVNTSTHALKGKSKIDEIDLFWGILKSRIVKFRGLNSNTTYLHIKETEFRYNNRHSDLFTVIHALIQKRPLHYLRQETALS